MSRTFFRENKDKKVEQQGGETEITWGGAWEGKKSVHLYYKYFRLLKLLGADKKKGWGEESWAVKSILVSIVHWKNAVLRGLQMLE